MTIRKDFNLGTLIPIGLLLITQTIGAVWWAATMTQKFENLEEAVSLNQTDFTNELRAETAQRTDDRRRIYDRLTAVEQITATVIAQSRADQASIQGITAQLSELRVDLRANSALLRDVLLKLNDNE